jgi:hypothetical protein
MLRNEPTSKTPSIEYDEARGILSIAGESYPKRLRVL